MMLEWLRHPETARGAAMAYRAVEKVCADPVHSTRDLGGPLSTRELGELVAAAV
jgi:isocitrate/isopropylmalate dehydrogenase